MGCIPGCLQSDICVLSIGETPCVKVHSHIGSNVSDILYILDSLNKQTNKTVNTL